MAQILPETEVTEFENRSYVNPQAALGESDTFIDNLRQTQQANTQQIAQDTYDLGTAVPSNLGGLMGGEGYWTSRYQTPQTNATVANLRAAAQAKALNDVLANEQAIWKNRYQQAYRNYQSRQNAKANASYGGGGDDDDEDPEYTSNGQKTGYDVTLDQTEVTNPVDIYDSTKVGFDNRSHEEQQKIKVTKDKNGNITSVSINGATHYGRDAKARYRELQRAGLVK